MGKQEIKGNRNGGLFLEKHEAKTGTHKVHDCRACDQRMARDDRYCLLQLDRQLIFGIAPSLLVCSIISD